MVRMQQVQVANVEEALENIDMVNEFDHLQLLTGIVLEELHLQQLAQGINKQQPPQKRGRKR
jgi:hypothetical protein